MRHAPPAARGAHATRSVPRPARAGFTLIEVALAIIIVGTGFLAIMAAQQAFHQKNSWSTNSSIAMALANHIREATWDLPQHDPVTACYEWGPETNEPDYLSFDDVDDWDGPDGTGLLFNPPINARREVIANLDRWTQIVTIANVNEFDINQAEVECGSDILKVRVQVLYLSPRASTPETMTDVSWIVPSD